MKKKGKKSFDCVEMKWEIQQRILAEKRNLDPAEARRLQREEIEQDPVLGPFLKKVREIRPRARRSQESS